MLVIADLVFDSGSPRNAKQAQQNCHQIFFRESPERSLFCLDPLENPVGAGRRVRPFYLDASDVIWPNKLQFRNKGPSNNAIGLQLLEEGRDRGLHHHDRRNCE